MQIGGSSTPGPNSVGTTQLKDGAVTSAKIDSTIYPITSSGIATGAVNTAAIAANAVTSAKVDGTVYVNAAASGSANITISTSAPSGGADGDIWFQY